MVSAIHYFPKGFLWGTATSSHQVEGDNTNNDWWAWEQEPGRIFQDHKSGKACDWWGGRWQDDFDRAAEGGQRAHRLSIEWSRIEPTQALWDDDALDHYREMIQGALKRGLTPMVTLHHFTNPIWVAERGGWLNPEIVAYFERYVRKVVSALGDLVELWVTINEPNVLACQSYFQGEWPPGEKRLNLVSKVNRHLVRAHAAAYHAIHEIRADSLVGLAHHYRGFRPANPANPLHRRVAKMKHTAFNDVFPRACQEGRIRFLFWRDRIDEARRTQDFFGLNYYTVERSSFNLFRPMSAFEAGAFAPDADLSPCGFIANEPSGLWDAIRWAMAYKMPIFITENGAEDENDQFRARYLATHVFKVWRAVNLNWPIRGYFHWSLIDNFEWEHGWSQRFGLWGVNPGTQERTKRPSAEFYAEICKQNGLSTEMVETYAPQVMDEMFSPRGPAELKIEG
ncbi:MAG: family 1 glycosylhydrolase [Anaerolineales bacterium]|nr:family 1 glycosylhydrolase [Anaerolineales bacterium]